MSTRLIQRAYKFALAPTPDQAAAFASHAGAARYAFNWGIARIFEAADARQAQKDAGQQPEKIPGHFDLCKMWVIYKNDPASDVPWVGDNSRDTYQAALRDAAVAWRNFMASKTGGRAGRRMGRPRFKSKHRTTPSFQLHDRSLRMVSNSRINLPKIGTVKVPGKVQVGTWVDRNARVSRSLARALRRPPVDCPACGGAGTVTEPSKPDMPNPVVTCRTCKGTTSVPAARIIRATISRGASGVWWCSVTAEVAQQIPDRPTRRQATNGTVGLDLGTRWLAVDSDATMHPNPQHLDQALAELAAAQRALSRCAKDSKRREKAKQRVGAIHERIALQRKDSTNRLSTRIARTFAGVAVEGWDAQQVAENNDATVPKRIRRRRNRQLTDAAPGALRWQLEYKASWYGATFHKVAPYQETGRTCSACGTVKTKPVPLHQDMFVCTACGVTIDRRVNSARVVKAAAGGAGKLGAGDPAPVKPRGGGVRPGAASRDGQPPVKRAARRARGRAGTPDP
jgi:putative transposase